ncbi:hypothetical protein LQ564_08330 [Massilia sp. G4R7]|uniref:Uncharacterized protein n=1 Tax=Massilia phyllostachyos TaxID=2898585 RepID=A0ABS8Q5I9_9BURK|nr:hypothetical protein [Massilia phyllostachyos]MCD2516322.1 hypothetical protein [Massilia phyllostachyos]
MRPNLMSPKRERTSGEDSILAMLERDPLRRRGAGGDMSGLRLACYGASGVVVLALTGALVWLAAGNDGLRPEVQRGVLAGADTAAPAPAVVQVALGADATPAARSGSAAVIVDQHPDGVPPLRMLKPVAPERTPAPAPKPAAKAPPAPPPAAVRPPAAAPSLVAKAPARARPPAPARPAVRPSAKAQRPAAPSRGAEAPVDPDVALISAVIVHANGHAPKESQMTELLCPNDSCGAPANRQ